MVEVSRRSFLTAAGGAAAITLLPTTFAEADVGTTTTKVISGHLETGVADFVYLPVEVRAEVRHPMSDGTAGAGWTMGPQLPFGPMAALTNPIFLGRR